jgi:hypothetical protein
MTPEERLAQRRARWSGYARQDNSKLYAGSPMFYYCRICGAEIVLSETHIEPAPWFCTECCIDGFAKGPREANPRPIPT